jgi:uncharacterized DUF497 family protein
LRERGLDADKIDLAFFMSAVIVPAKGASRTAKAVGMFEGHRCTVIFEWYGREAIKLRTIYPASKKDKERYERYRKANPEMDR